jgi:Flp pilus assembly protein TadG
VPGPRPPLPENDRSKGNISLELGLILPLFLLILAGVIDLGMLYWQKHILTQGTQEGARAAALAGVTGVAANSKTQVMQVVQDCLDRAGLTDAQGNQISLTMDGNFFYTWDTSGFPGKLRVELKNIPVKMMLLPSVQQLYQGEVGQAVVDLSAGTTMGPAWTSGPSP